MRYDNRNVGTAYGCWAKIPLEELNQDSVIYSFGAGEDICHEFILSGQTNSEIHIFDPTPRAKIHYDHCVKVLNTQKIGEYNPSFGGGDANYEKYIKDSMANGEKLFFHSYGIYDEDKEIDFYYPSNRNHVSLSIDNLQRTKDKILLTVKTIDTIMKTLGHDTVDLVKMNIEGAEVASLLYMLEKTEIRPKLISVKFELIRDKRNPETEEKMTRLWTGLSKDYGIIYEDRPRFNYTFARN